MKKNDDVKWSHNTLIRTDNFGNNFIARIEGYLFNRANLKWVNMYWTTNTTTTGFGNASKILGDP